ncbi:MAG TPA: glycosyl hydrolase family 18 protein [Tepidisphaeraceae bacterium]|jgi:hypothetical protein
MIWNPVPPRWACSLAWVGVIVSALGAPGAAWGQQSSMSAWQASDFRVWGYIPYWASSSQISGFATNGMYGHVSDVLYFGAVRPDASGNLSYGAASYQTNLNTLRSQSGPNGFNLHLSMMAVNGSSVNTVWTSIISSAANRANFTSQLKTLMAGGAGTADDIKGMNFDWERPDLAADWGNYTQLAREVRAAFKDPSTPSTNNWEVSVCDYGSTDSSWDDTNLFDAKVYDQLMMMVYHLGKTSTNTWANTKLALTGQGADKAFANDQVAVGFGTWGDNGPATVDLKTIVAADPNLPYDALTFTGTIKDINGNTQTGTWDIESRKQVREKTQLAFDRGMPGMFSWTLHYDATNNLGLHRVIHHYTMVKRDTPDLNLDGKVDATDATALANNMGMALTNTGVGVDAQFDAFYLNGNWEKGDRDGNGWVNQADANWLASRYTALGVTLPDRLAYSGTFESFASAKGLNGRWRAGRDGSNSLKETSNFKQESPNFLTWSGSGAWASNRSNNFVTIRNQTATEGAAGVNTLSRSMQADLTSAINLGTGPDIFFTFLVRENSGALTGSQLASSNRTLSLQFLDAAGVNQFDFTLKGLEQLLGINSQADATGQDVSLGGFGTNTTYLLVGKLAANGNGANTLQASIFPSGSVVGNFTSPSFAWMLTALGSANYNPIITSILFSTPAEANYTVSNLWLGTAATMVPEPGMVGVAAVGLMALRGRRRR